MATVPSSPNDVGRKNEGRWAFGHEYQSKSKIRRSSLSSHGSIFSNVRTTSSPMLTLAFVVSSISVNCVPLRPHFRSRYPRSRALSFILTSPDNSISKCLLSFRAFVPNSGAQLSLRVLKCLAASCERPKPFIVSRTSFKTRSPKPAVVLPEDLSTNVALAVSVANKVKALIASRHCWSPWHCWRFYSKRGKHTH